MATITLTVGNAALLPGGAPAQFRAAGRGFWIGRDPGLDWTLPDPSRTVSARHCEVRFEQGEFWLHDRSTNGVFLNGSSQRVQGPHRLADGDRLMIGRYVIAATIQRSSAVQRAGNAAGDAWNFGPRSGIAVGGGASREADRTGPEPEAAGAAARRTAAASARAETTEAQGTAVPDPFVAAFCAGAGLRPEALAGRDRLALATEVGEFVRLTAEHLGSLLKARAAAKAMTRSASRTVLGTADNNPLKFVPSPAEAVEAMLGRSRPGFLDSRRSLEDAFGDLARHELATYAAMQKALARLLEPLDPGSIELKAGGSAFGSRKSRAWDLFVERWEEREKGENGMLDAFLLFFAEAYDEANKGK